MRLTEPQLRLNSGPRALRASCSTAHGAQMIWPLDYMGRLMRCLCTSVLLGGCTVWAL